MPMITISLCSIAFRNDPIEDLIPRIAADGYDAVEIFFGQLDGKTEAELANIKEIADEHKLEILVIAPYFILTRGQENYDNTLVDAQRYVDYGRALGATKMRTFTDVGPTGVGSDVVTPEQRAMCVKGLKVMTAMAPEMQWVLETHGGTLADTVESILKLIEEVGAPNLKVNFQVSNFVDTGLLQAYDALEKHIDHMHIHNRSPEGGGAYVYEGTINYEKFFKEIQARGYDESLSIEYCWKGVPYEESAKAYQYVAKILGR